MITKKRINHYVSIAYGLLILFAFIGNCVGNQNNAVVVVVITTIFWAASKIMSEAIEAYLSLRTENDSSEKNDKADT